ncbi:MAG TPA: serine hydrolase [Chloroflexota bacterium]|nr:serine hydrolase [Chloroflexota bacterium]
MRYHLLFMLLLAMGLLMGCQQTPAASSVAAVQPVLATEWFTAVPLPTVPPASATPLPVTLTPIPSPTPVTPTTVPPTATPYYTGSLSPACGQLLPILPTHTTPQTTILTPDGAALTAVQNRIPQTAVTAWQYILNHPGDVGLVAYRVGDEANGVYLNADVQMPLASVVKLIPLVAYVEAVSSGELSSTGFVSVDALDAYYLPGYDLRSHNRALTELADRGLLSGEPPQVRLEDVPWMMIRHSSNAAADYLHLLLGQERVEATAVSLGLTNQTAPCTWLGQFMAMGNHTRSGSDDAAIQGYLADGGSYGREASQLTDAYVNDPVFRETERAWHQENRRPTGQTQRLFSHALNAHGSPQEYAALMARIAQNGLSNPESSYLARKYLEWPMVFADNQELFSNLGYKNGSLPGILTTAYYAYPKGEVTPIVVILFFRNLPQPTYRQWRDALPHDEFARWLLYDPAAIPAVKNVIGNR